MRKQWRSTKLRRQTAIVYATIEKLTIGQGYIQEPVKLKFSKGDTYADVMLQILKNLNLSYKSTTSQYGFYLSAIQDNDNSPAVIPQIILDALAKEDDDVSTSRTNQGWLASSTTRNIPVGCIR